MMTIWRLPTTLGAICLFASFAYLSGQCPLPPAPVPQDLGEGGRGDGEESVRQQTAGYRRT
jgi:hypothetical protein